MLRKQGVFGVSVLDIDKLWVAFRPREAPPPPPLLWALGHLSVFLSQALPTLTFTVINEEPIALQDCVPRTVETKPDPGMGVKPFTKDLRHRGHSLGGVLTPHRPPCFLFRQHLAQV